ncbi:manganese efflux pump MntP [Anaerosinus gibii]|uniref:Manganese efflux pump n=1 Tax=Selenobaculum gibii TaxID=3054208 RepID=A0A9Y2AJG6_9FIRM|nr:manganese efflux pump [Selenobaculum gbiensis]WIW70956.1 manganese efflux pump [Selenobaculum gbiensis]
MTDLELFIMSVALGMDLFSIAIPIGMNRLKKRVIIKASIVFATFHITMLLSGCYIGGFLGKLIDRFGAESGLSVLMLGDWAGAITGVVLAGLGVKMIRESLVTQNIGHVQCNNPLTGMTLIVLAFSVSIDALAIGFGIGMIDVNLIKLNIILGSVIFIISLIGLNIGRQAGRFLGEYAERIGGFALILLGGQILWNLLG